MQRKRFCSSFVPSGTVESFSSSISRRRRTSWRRKERVELSIQKETFPVLFLSAHGNIAMAVHAVRHGAVDFLEKPVDPMVFLQKVSRAVTAAMTDAAAEAKASDVRERFASLTPREREVVEAVLDNQPNKVIARNLGLEVSTVKMHRANAFAKLGVHSPAELIRLAYESGFSAPGSAE